MIGEFLPQVPNRPDRIKNSTIIYLNEPNSSIQVEKLNCHVGCDISSLNGSETLRSKMETPLFLHTCGAQVSSQAHGKSISRRPRNRCTVHRAHRTRCTATSSTESDAALVGTVRDIAGTPDVVDVLRLSSSDVQDWASIVEAAFPFNLDSFQRNAMKALASGRSVIVSAPTGSGKTVVGEMAVYLALSRQMRVFYTTPLKALSNQKFADFKRQFGEHRVGLLTGDTTVNRDAEVLVMTTEVYRNMLYASESGELVGGIEGARGIIDDVHAVVLDEFHYMNDSSRGTVWEESVIISPPHVLLVALSATMSNSEELRDWFEDVHGPTDLIVSSFRPVPLRFGFAANDGLYPLFGKKAKSDEKLVVHPRLYSRTKAATKPHPKSSGKPNLPHFLRNQLQPPSFNFLVRVLNRQNLLPGIIFVFSRVGCDRAALEASKQQTPLVTHEEAARLRERLDAFQKLHPGAVQEHRVNLAKMGVSSHHAGILPLWKCMVEELFQEGLIKVVFATETLAAGINMPARTTVLAALSKRNGDVFEPLTTSAVLQMSGRAGRRGKDTVGNAVVMQSEREGAFEAFNILTSGVDAITSQFTPTYGMALNLLQKRTMADIRQLLEKSFGSFLSRRTSTPPLSKSERDNANNYEAFEKAREFLETYPDQNGLREFEQLRQQLTAARKSLDSALGIQREAIREQARDMLLFAPPGSLVILENPPRRRLPEEDQVKKDEFGLVLSDFRNLFRSDLDVERVVLIGRVIESKVFSKSAGELFLAITGSNKVRLFDRSHVESIDMGKGNVDKFPAEIRECLVTAEESLAVSVSVLSALMPPIDTFRKYRGGQYRAPGIERTSAAAAMLTDFDPVEDDSRVKQCREKVDRLVDSIRDSSILQSGNKDAVLSSLAILRKYEAVASKLRVAYRNKHGTTWADFLAITDMLRKYGYLSRTAEGFEVTELGRLGASVRAENELWVSVILMTDSLGRLSPVNFVGVLAAVIAEESRLEMFIGFETSPETMQFCREMERLQSALLENQSSYGLTFPVNLIVQESTLAEAWARGVSWQEMIDCTSLQEGDICRKLRRLLDVLRQIPRLPVISESIKLNAKRALSLMDRFPVADDVTYSIGDDEKLDVGKEVETTAEEDVVGFFEEEEIEAIRSESMVSDEEFDPDTLDEDDDLMFDADEELYERE